MTTTNKKSPLDYKLEYNNSGALYEARYSNEACALFDSFSSLNSYLKYITGASPYITPTTYKALNCGTIVVLIAVVTFLNAFNSVYYVFLEPQSGKLFLKSEASIMIAFKPLLI